MIQFQTPPLLTISDVMRITGYKSRSTIYRLINAGNCPKPVKIGGDRIRWRSQDIENWLQSLPTQSYR
jgi:prophage regulatory protein